MYPTTFPLPSKRNKRVEMVREMETVASKKKKKLKIKRLWSQGRADVLSRFRCFHGIKLDAGIASATQAIFSKSKVPAFDDSTCSSSVFFSTESKQGASMT